VRGATRDTPPGEGAGIRSLRVSHAQTEMQQGDDESSGQRGRHSRFSHRVRPTSATGNAADCSTPLPFPPPRCRGQAGTLDFHEYADIPIRAASAPAGLGSFFTGTCIPYSKRPFWRRAVWERTVPTIPELPRPRLRCQRDVRTAASSVLRTFLYRLIGKQLPTVKEFISAGSLDSTGRYCYLGLIAGGRQNDSRESWAAAAKIVLATRDGLHDQ
jgi:hypothetical protein